MTRRQRPLILAAATALLLPMALTGCRGEATEPTSTLTGQTATSSGQTSAATSEPSPSPTPSAEPREFSLMVTGDVLLHPQLLDEAAAAADDNGAGQDYDFSPLLAGLEPYVQDADVALCNLETPVGDAPYSGYPTFKVPTQIVADVAQIGYDGCTTATNHTMDAGVDGVISTLDALEEQELFATGSYRTKAEAAAAPLLDIDGIKLGVIATTYSLNGFSEDANWRVDTGVDATELIERAEAARQAGADLVVAAIHDGAEYSTEPTASQRKLGRALAASGAFDFIYMHHTHSVLPIEKYDDTWIVYGLGNSVAKHATPTVLNREGISVKATFTQDADEDWSVSTLQWVPHLLSTAPVTWCQVFEVQDNCVPEREAEASLARTAATVDAYGAIEDGLTEWTLP